MSLSSRFNHDLCKKLGELMPSYDWCAERKLDTECREAVDVGCPAKSARSKPILIEVELKREDPASNILKVWGRFINGAAYPHGLVLIQGFSKVYRSPKYHNRRLKYDIARKLGSYIEVTTRRRFKYFAIDIPYRPHAGSNEGDGARRNAAHWLAKEVASKMKQ